MITVKVNAILEMAAILSGRELVLSLPEGSRVSNLLVALVEKYGQPLTGILYGGENRELRPELNLLLNGRNIIFLDGLNTELIDGNELFFLPPVGGG